MANQVSKSRFMRYGRTSRAEAEKARRRCYFTGERCETGHRSERPSSRFADEAKRRPWNEVLMLPGGEDRTDRSGQGSEGGADC
jgi:hypothetical protein